MAKKEKVWDGKSLFSIAHTEGVAEKLEQVHIPSEGAVKKVIIDKSKAIDLEQIKQEKVFFLDRIKQAYKCKEEDIPEIIKKYKWTYRIIDWCYTILKKNKIMIQINPNPKR